MSDDTFRLLTPVVKTTGNTIIPKEQLTAFERWELASFDPRPAITPKPISPEAKIAATQSAEAELQVIQQKAHDEGRQQGYDSGYQAGYAAGMEQAQQEALQLHQLMQTLQAALSQVDEQLAQSLLDLSLEIARKMVLETLKIQPEVVLKIVSKAIGSLPHYNQNAHLILNPDDAELVKKHMGEQLANAGWKIFNNAQVERGGCRVETAHSNVDATNPTRWQHIVASIGQDKSWLT